jgi:RND family efflux transporter MFP subunit
MQLKSIPSWLWQHKIPSLILLVIIIGVIIYAINASKPPKFDKAMVKRGEIATVAEASGVVTADKTAELNFANTGKVVWVGVKKGDIVKPYQTLASQDVREVEKNIKSKLLDYMKTRWDFEQLHEDKNVDGRDLAVVPNLSDAELRALQKSQFGLDQSVLDVEVATLAKEQAYLFSPIEGTVVDDGNIMAGEWINATNLSSKTIKVTDLNTLYFQANIDEADFGKIALGQPVTIKLDAFPGEIVNGTISYLGKEGVKKTGGSVQIPVDISLTSVPSGIVPGLNGDVTIILEKKSDILTLDKKFVHKDGDKYTVSIMENSRPVTKPVTIGMVGLTDEEITSGLTEDQEVVNVIK